MARVNIEDKFFSEITDLVAMARRAKMDPQRAAGFLVFLWHASQAAFQESGTEEQLIDWMMAPDDETGRLVIKAMEKSGYLDRAGPHLFKIRGNESQIPGVVKSTRKGKKGGEANRLRWLERRAKEAQQVDSTTLAKGKHMLAQVQVQVQVQEQVQENAEAKTFANADSVTLAERLPVDSETLSPGQPGELAAANMRGETEEESDTSKPETGYDYENIDSDTRSVGEVSEDIKPKKNRSESKSKAKAVKDPGIVDMNRKTWAAYSEAYLARYKVEPVRNLTMNSIIAAVVKRLGAEAPDVVRFYVSHPGRWYVQAGHSVNLCLKDAEKLRTEWATKRVVSEASSRASELDAHNARILDQFREGP